MGVQTQRSSEEAFRFFKKKPSAPRKKTLILGRSLPICGATAPQMHF